MLTLKMSFFSLLMFDVLGTHVCARVKDLSFRLGNRTPAVGLCVGTVITHIHTNRGVPPMQSFIKLK